jgi:hypothetical protein
MGVIQTKNPGDRIDHGDRITRYAMVGDTYMTSTQVGDRADALWAKFSSSTYFRPGIFAEICWRLGLAVTSPTETEAIMILAKADVTWADIGRMKS